MNLSYTLTGRPYGVRLATRSAPPLQIHSHVHTHTFRYTYAHETYALSLQLQVAFTQPSHIQNRTHICMYTHVVAPPLSLYFILKPKRWDQGWKPVTPAFGFREAWTTHGNNQLTS